MVVGACVVGSCAVTLLRNVMRSRARSSQSMLIFDLRSGYDVPELSTTIQRVCI